ncbi:MAG: serine hydrolase, partial [Clostridia bacterium]|nr:serine hydrolase [Clostridia bacterium]
MSKDILTFTSPAAAGVSPKCVSTFLDDVRARELALHSFVFLRHGKVFAEGYAAPFKEGEFHRMYSVSKTFVSMAVGALIGEGKLSLDDPVSKYLPEFSELWVDDGLWNGKKMLHKAQNVLTVR